MFGSQPGELASFLEAINSDLKSHPEKKLCWHLSGVWKLSQQLREGLSVPVDPMVLQLVTLTHDAGKAHPNFQIRLEDPSIKQPHAAPSAWLTLALGLEYGLSMESAIWAAETVRRHHTGLLNIIDTLGYWYGIETKGDFLQDKQMALVSLPGLKNSVENIDLSRMKKSLKNFEKEFDDENEFYSHLKIWLNVRLLYSLLIAADRMDAIDIQKMEFIQQPVMEIPEFDNPDAAVNQWRQQVQEECFKNAVAQITEPGLYSLTLPTGAGKTITGLRIASMLAQKNNLSSLIYVLPFISIVEQTAITARLCFPEDLIQEDHSLVPINPKEASTSWQQMTSFFRYWHQPIIITTMAQFWESLFGTRANQTMNFHRLSNAVIILDEPQTLPPKYWWGLGKLLDFLAKQLGSYFIFMTATQPHISQRPEQVYEIAPQNVLFPDVRHGYQVKHIDSPVPMSELKNTLLNEKLLDTPQAGMLVLNTKRAALEAFNLVSNLLGDNDEIELLFLSAWLTPWRRGKILERLKELEKASSPRILVSTQVVEAGVDLDFKWVIRDLGPLDSIIQVAGRCNRHKKQNELGQIFTTWLEDDHGHDYASYVYDRVLLEATRDVLKRKPDFDEKDVPDLIDSYYRAILDRLTPQDIVGDLKAGKWGKAPVLYPTSPQQQIQMIIEETDEVAELIQTLEETQWHLSNLTVKKNTMRRLRQFIIDIPIKIKPKLDLFCVRKPHSESLLREVLGGQMLLLTREMIGTRTDDILYDEIKGFLPPEDTDPPLFF